MVEGYTACFPCLRFSFVGWANNWALGPLPTYPAYLGAPLVSWITRDLLMSPPSAGKGRAHRTPLIWAKVGVLRWVRESAHKKGPRGRFGLFFLS